MNTNAKHTPLPWHTNTRVTNIYDATERLVACCDYQQIAPASKHGNAEFIVRACNSHYELIEALRKLVFWLETPETAEQTGIKWRDALDQARTALTSAQGKEN